MSDNLFQPFLDEYPPENAVGCTPDQLRDLFPFSVQGLGELLVPYAGASFYDAMYRLHRAEAIPTWTAIAWDTFPEYRERAYPFGYDWLGRQFALDAQRRDGEECLVLMLEPGANRVLEIPATFLTFHNEELVTYPEEAVGARSFELWILEADEPLQPSQCMGFKVPLFLGGEDTLENLERSDMDVYWTICGQLLEQVRDLPPGTPITSVTVSGDSPGTSRA